jgi:hypothetical protein
LTPCGHARPAEKWFYADHEVNVPHVYRDGYDDATRRENASVLRLIFRHASPKLRITLKQQACRAIRSAIDARRAGFQSLKNMVNKPLDPVSQRT